jgi:hypothetical protein
MIRLVDQRSIDLILKNKKFEENKNKEIKKISEENKNSSTGESCGGHTETVLKAVTLVADHALVIKPVDTVLEFALSLNQIVFIRTSLALTSTLFNASLNLASSSLQFVMGKTVFAHSPLISEASLSNWLAFPVDCKVISAFAGDTSVIVQDSALLELAVLTVQGEW